MPVDFKKLDGWARMKIALGILAICSILSWSPELAYVLSSVISYSIANIGPIISNVLIIGKVVLGTLGFLAIVGLITMFSIDCSDRRERKRKARRWPS